MRFPKTAEKVRQFIREKVKRPRQLPVVNPITDGALGFLRKTRKSWKVCLGAGHPVCCCPLGLVRTSTSPLPSTIDQVGVADPPFDQHEMHAFIDWWDEQTDPKKAVDAVWGRKKGSEEP